MRRARDQKTTLTRRRPVAAGRGRRPRRRHPGVGGQPAGQPRFRDRHAVPVELHRRPRLRGEHPGARGTKALQGAASASDNAKCTQTVAVQPNTAYSLTGWVRGNYVYLGVDGGASTWTPGAAAYTQLTVPSPPARRRPAWRFTRTAGTARAPTSPTTSASTAPAAPACPACRATRRRHDHQHLDRAVVGRVQRHGHRLPGVRGHDRAGHRDRHLDDDHRAGRVLGAQLHGRGVQRHR